MQKGSDLESLVKEHSKVHFYELNENDKEHKKYIKFLFEKNKNSKEIVELKKLNEKKILIKGDVFFVFPDKYILKGTFNLIELRTKLFDFVREYLKKPNEKFNLYNIDDHHKLVNENKINLLASKFDFPLTLKVDFPVFYCNLQENKINDLTVKIF